MNLQPGVKIGNNFKGLKEGDIIGWKDSPIDDRVQQEPQRSASTHGFAEYPYNCTDLRGGIKKYKIVGISTFAPLAHYYTKQYIPEGHINYFLDLVPLGSEYNGFYFTDGDQTKYRMFWCINLTQHSVVNSVDGNPLMLVTDLYHYPQSETDIPIGNLLETADTYKNDGYLSDGSEHIVNIA